MCVCVCVNVDVQQGVSAMLLKGAVYDWCRGGLMYVHVIGWETAKKDKIDLEGSKLKEKQGLYTCPPSSPNQLPFHCCLEVKEEQIKVQSQAACRFCLWGPLALSSVAQDL